MAAELGNIFNCANTKRKHIPQNSAATDKSLVPILAFYLGTKNKSELDDRSWIRVLTGVKNERKYDGCLHETA